MRKLFGELLLALVSSLAWGQTIEDNKKQCATISESTIKACTALIESNQLSTEDLATTYANGGIANNKIGQYDQAVTDANRAIDLRPDANAYAIRGTAYRRKGLEDQAIADYTKAIALNPEPSSCPFAMRIAPTLTSRGEHSIRPLPISPKLFL